MHHRSLAGVLALAVLLVPALALAVLLVPARYSSCRRSR